jgi:mRNA interferase RelE/StbE
MELIFTARAARDLKGLDKALALRIVAELEKVASNPFGRHAKTGAMKGEPPTFRLRVGDHRAVYSIDRAHGTVIVTRVGDRKEIYR